jgi:hypothetical protein
VNITICIPIMGSWNGDWRGREGWREEDKKQTQALAYY